MPLLDRLPEPLSLPGPRGLTWGQWVVLPLLFLAAWGLGLLLGRLTRAALTAIARRTSVTWDDRLVDGMRGPLTLAWAVLSARVLMPAIGLQGVADGIAHKTMRTAVFVAFFWFLMRLVTMLGEVVSSSIWAKARPATRSLVPLGVRILQVGVIAMAVVAVLADFGYPVASLVAGLGIGGLALALAGQKTVENLFGAFSIGVDQPFRVGDFVSVDGVLGHVESIGLRSTRIRTLERTLVTLPNGKLADMRIECFAPRDRIRFVCTLGLVYGTTAQQMREVLAGCRRVLEEHPKIFPEGVAVFFREFGASSLDVEVQAWFMTADMNEFRAFRQEVLLAFMDLVERAGTAFAFPTRTVHVVDGKRI